MFRVVRAALLLLVMFSAPAPSFSQGFVLLANLAGRPEGAPPLVNAPVFLFAEPIRGPDLIGVQSWSILRAKEKFR
jgi:hypothetical protein